MKLNELHLNWSARHNSKRPDNFDNGDYVLLRVNIKDTFDNAHRGYELDIEDETGGKNAIGNRLDRAKKHFEKGLPMDPPEIAYNPHTNTVDYIDGRHRAVAAYQLGYEYIPMFVYRNNIDGFKNIVRTK